MLGVIMFPRMRLSSGVNRNHLLNRLLLQLCPASTPAHGSTLLPDLLLQQPLSGAAEAQQGCQGACRCGGVREAGPCLSQGLHAHGAGTGEPAEAGGGGDSCGFVTLRWA